MTALISARRAEAHETLMAQSTRLLAQAEAIAVRRPEEAVSPTIAALAGDLLFELRRLLNARGLPAVAPDYAGLAAQLGQAVAGLEAFEARHTVWDAALGAFAWQITPTLRQPVARLRPHLATPTQDAARRQGDSHRRLVRLLQVRERERFEQGFAAGRHSDIAAPEAAPDYPVVQE